MKALLPVAVPAAAYFILLFRISAFRRDRPREQKLGRRSPRYFGLPYENIGEVFRGANYMAEGQRLLPWLVVAIAMVALGMLAVLIGLAR
jgi:hypothetical protein